MDKHRDGARKGPSEPRWRDALAKLGGRDDAVDRLQEALGAENALRLRYHINLRESRLRDRLIIDLFTEGPEGPRPFQLRDGDTSRLSAADRDIVSLLFGAQGEDRARGRHAPEGSLGRCAVRPGLYRLLLPQLVRTELLFADLALPEVAPDGPLEFGRSNPFDVRLVVESAGDDRFRMWGALVRERERYALEAPRLLLSDGLALVDRRLLLVAADARLEWALRLRRHGAVEFPSAAKDGFLLELAQMPDVPELELPPELHWSQVSMPPQPRVVFSVDDSDEEVTAREAVSLSPYVRARVVFDYGGTTVAVNSRETAVVDENGRRLFRRDLAVEREHLERLRPLDLDLEGRGVGELRLPKRGLAEVVKALVEAEWSVETDGAELRAHAQLRTKVKSGIDWFDLDGVLEFTSEATVKLPELLRAAQAGRSFVRLADGSRGLVPDWVKGYAQLARFGRTVGGSLRFLPSQAGVIDALLAGHDEADVDVRFENLRDQLDRAATPEQVLEPEGFHGKLRDYQRGGVAWMRFLARHNYGGCLADDMGLGKTVQVLCLLQGLHPPQGSASAPSVVVVPKSLVHNWVAEAAKFTTLRVLDFTGSKREGAHLEDHDVVVTTYGTLRKEILRFTEFRFNALILDEAQAIKNPRSQAAKACRLVQADHRLAISGTPIENGLDELWSLFEFLNPGMLGGLGEFAAPGRDKDDEWLESLSRALKPFMLRRTKSQVLHELPEKQEQLWEIPLGEEERTRYDELREYYRGALQGVLEGREIDAKSRIHVLEALLRLRQAACHPGLIDPTQLDAPSAKIDALFEKLHQIVPRGHKALVFSQFTTLLEIVRRRLARDGIGHAYLDGGTADRSKTVRAFTEDPDCGVFLISLKAGGCGLNLTESDYVFILDPWWNPAIEAQAVDRAHRMGQKNRVFAYKMITTDTVEQKIVALQGEKRRLADAIVTADTGPLAGLRVEDLSALLERVPMTESHSR